MIKIMSMIVMACCGAQAWAGDYAAPASTKHLVAQNKQLHLQVALLKHKLATQAVANPADTRAAAQRQARVGRHFKHKHHASLAHAIGQASPQVASTNNFEMVDPDSPAQDWSYLGVGPYSAALRQGSIDDLLINTPGIGADALILTWRAQMNKNGLLATTRAPRLLLSGDIAGSMSYSNNQTSKSISSFGGSTNDINLHNADIDILVLMPSPWLTGFMSINYDAGSLSAVSNNTVSNSRLYLDNAFITIGNFAYSPFYVTIGQAYAPFGRYASSFISKPLTKALGKTIGRFFLVGYDRPSTNTAYASLYALNGDTYTVTPNNVTNGGINLGYRANLSYAGIGFKSDIAMSMIANIADAAAMQNNGYAAPLFGGFGNITTGKEQLKHIVPAIDLRWRFSFNDQVSITNEYVFATKAFYSNDLSYGQHGAKPSAYNAEVSYAFPILERPSNIGLMYGASGNALAVGLAKNMFGVVFNTSVWHNTSQSIEVMHVNNYAATTVANGSTTDIKLNPIRGLGANSNTIKLQFSIYF